MTATVKNEAGKFFVITGDYTTDRNSAFDLGLIAVKSIKKPLLYTMIDKYNATFSTESSTAIDTESSTAIDTESSTAIELARKTFDMVYSSSPIVAVEPVKPKTALDEVLDLGIDQDLADRLVKQFQENKAKRSTGSSKAKKDPIENSIKIAESLEKHKTVYYELLDLTDTNKKDHVVRTKAQMILALKYDSSAGRIGFMYTAYKLYTKYPTIKNAIDLGQITLSKLATLGTRADRSVALSELLGYPVTVNLD